MHSLHYRPTSYLMGIKIVITYLSKCWVSREMGNIYYHLQFSFELRVKSQELILDYFRGRTIHI
jgi:hypothetical protein